MKTVGYIVFLALLAFTIFNLIATATAKRRKTYATSSFAVALRPIEENLLKEQKKRNLKFGIVKRIANDQNQAFIFCYDRQAKIFAVGTEGTTVIEKASELDHIYKEYKVGKFGRVMESTVGFTVQGTDYLFPIATKPYWKKGILGSVLYETTEDFHQALKDAEADAKANI